MVHISVLHLSYVLALKHKMYLKTDKYTDIQIDIQRNKKIANRQTGACVCGFSKYLVYGIVLSVIVYAVDVINTYISYCNGAIVVL